MPQKQFNSLKHTKVNLEDGGMVLVLDTGAVINPEAEAMLQALHSRSSKGVLSHLEIIKDKGPEKFMSSFYVGYGHKSIGDCGSCTIFIEGVSMLVAKAVQDWMLYSGQESSTRYIDFSKQRLKDPINTKRSSKILENWRKFYLNSQGLLRTDLIKRYPKDKNEDDTIYQKAISARSFDILRGFLPSGTTTNLAWHTNLRQAADKLTIMRNHPLKEVRNVANAILDCLKGAYPSSFSHKFFDKTEKYNENWISKQNYYTNRVCPDFKLVRNNINIKLLSKYKDALSSRPPKTELPKFIAECGTLQFEFLLDFGSFRDLQRHRAIIQRMPLLTMDHGFESWYSEELSDELRNKARKLIKEQGESIRSLNVTKEIAQYYIPMGYRVPNRITGDLPALIYLTELRSTRFVHPTLQKRAIQMANIMLNKFAKFGLVIHFDNEIGRFDAARGKQDIFIKNN
jgi:thymidylate synthase ThyX